MKDYSRDVVKDENGELHLAVDEQHAEALNAFLVTWQIKCIRKQAGTETMNFDFGSGVSEETLRTALSRCAELHRPGV